MSGLPTRVSSEGGGIVLLTAMLLFFFLVFGSIAVDLGNWYVHKRHLQTQVDAAALAGGGLFGLCFAEPSAAYGAMTAEATRYGGVGSSDLLHPNTQVGGSNQGALSMLYQSKTYDAGGPSPDDTEEGDPCLTPSLMFDVKGIEEDLPTLLLGTANIPFLGSVGISSFGTVRTHARVQLKKVVSFKGSLPLAVPEVRPKKVTATFVNSSGTAVSTFELTGPTASGNLNAWSGSGSVAVPAGAMLGLRIGVGQVVGACAKANGTGGTGYVCYDYSDFTGGLVSIAGYNAAGTPADPVRSSFEVSPVTCSGSPFFSELAPLTGGATCSASVQAKLHFASGTALPADVETFEATVTGPKGFKVTRALTESAGEWSTGYNFAIPVDEGPYEVSLDWKYKGGGKKAFSTVQRFYSASDDAGPIKSASLSSSSGNAYSLPSGTHTISVGVALEGNLKLTPSTEMVMLRLTGGSRSSAVACDGPGADEFRDAIINGCSTPYQINVAGICPDPAPPAGAADCVPTQTGTTAGPTLQALDDRFSTCPSYDWPPPYEPDDPRIVPMMITDFSALGGSGTTDVPVTNFASFYVAGWTGSKCSTNAPPPFDVKKGAIWGHFVKYAEPDPNAEAGPTCDLTAVTPCIPVLTR